MVAGLASLEKPKGSKYPSGLQSPTMPFTLATTEEAAGWRGAMTAGWLTSAATLCVGVVGVSGGVGGQGAGYASPGSCSRGVCGAEAAAHEVRRASMAERRSRLSRISYSISVGAGGLLDALFGFRGHPFLLKLCN